jgi:predicted RNA binding protein YcfA (HicA-like mRNA interferase family)
VTLYYTTGDVPKGTLSEILKQARVNMTVYDFLRM